MLFLGCVFLDLLLKTVLNLLERLILAFDLDPAHVRLGFLQNVDSLLLGDGHLAWHVRDDASDDDFDEDDDVLHEDADEDDVGAVPEVRVPVLEVLYHGGLLFELEVVQVLGDALLGLVGEATEEQDQYVDGNRNEGDKAHDAHPAADTVRARSEVPAPE